MNFLATVLASISETDLKSIVKPITDVVDTIVPILLALVGSIGAIYCIILGVKFAKADDPQEHDKAKKALVYAVLGYVAIFLLLCMLHLGSDVLTDYYESTIESS